MLVLVEVWVEHPSVGAFAARVRLLGHQYPQDGVICPQLVGGVQSPGGRTDPIAGHAQRSPRRLVSARPRAAAGILLHRDHHQVRRHADVRTEPPCRFAQSAATRPRWMTTDALDLLLALAQRTRSRAAFQLRRQHFHGRVSWVERLEWPVQSAWRERQSTRVADQLWHPWRVTRLEHGGPLPVALRRHPARTGHKASTQSIAPSAHLAPA